MNLSANVDGTSRPNPERAIPGAILADPALTASAIRVLGVLLLYARHKAICWPGNATIAEGAGLSLATVKRGLAALKERGHIRVEKVPTGRGNLTGRRIFLAWRERDAALPRQLSFLPPAEPSPGAPLSHEERSREMGNRGHGTARPVASTPEPGPGGGAGGRATAELIRELPGRPELVGPVAARLGLENRDTASVGYYRSVASRVARGEEPAERLADAYRASRDSRAARPGALFAVFWKGWIARPSASASARPVAPPADPAERERARAAEAERHQEVKEFLAGAASDPASPWYRIMRRPGSGGGAARE